MDNIDFESPSPSNVMDNSYLVFSQKCIDALDPGKYLIQQIYGDAWEEVILKFFSPKVWGKVFKREVVDHRLKNIRVLYEHSGNSMLSPDRQILYEIKNES